MQKNVKLFSEWLNESSKASVESRENLTGDAIEDINLILNDGNVDWEKMWDEYYGFHDEYNTPDYDAYKKYFDEIKTGDNRLDDKDSFYDLSYEERLDKYKDIVKNPPKPGRGVSTEKAKKALDNFIHYDGVLYSMAFPDDNTRIYGNIIYDGDTMETPFEGRSIFMGKDDEKYPDICSSSKNYSKFKNFVKKLKLIPYQSLYKKFK
jgi:hypothetical protein